ncbi:MULTISPECIES: P-type conjugative transfer protein TrbJ [Stakelama]|uniref:P-type conjugative transfer protein TrbJ n=2 Tax=Stakelama TaxID=1124625 RepID=A0A8T4IFV2_9SPHN|nr:MULTISPECIES: P-type conjugative transfer protein TrbJ [Stakelama]MAW99930.1 P-type conjugative transfer protein TrbJ [Sphingomonas sp.]MBR0552754.1 P-type conjugative transfer protein TrbJ [Stakelama marina]TDN85310.1 P-type conjugative transfer protein TrbJ [Stakelama pacifica]GGO93014.1 conjugal transfer protein TrbJ [Stakelama pacifica]|tara:strand:- start:2415 stop:3161 length:747 start_codon:yes stop_codon:yes gene_type:complete
MSFDARKYFVSSALTLGTLVSFGVALTLPATPAAAQFTVFDPSNYSQNLLTAARTLQQINNQIQSLQNEASMLLNQAKNLRRVDFPEVETLNRTLQQIDQLMGEAKGVGFRVDGLDRQFRRLFPRDFDQALSSDERVIAARTRLGTAMDAYHETMTVQAQVVENVASDAATLRTLIARSQGAEGALQVQQATNQLLALTAKQQLQLQNMMAAQYRAQAVEAARRAQAESDARATTKRFLGSGSAYTPQ